MSWDDAELIFGPRTAPYYIYIYDYSEMSSGVRVMHSLCHALNMLGYEAYVTPAVTSGSLNTPQLTEGRRQAHREAGRLPVVVFPETQTANPFNDLAVVRYLLNKPGVFIPNWNGSFGENDLIFYLDQEFLIDGLQGTRLYTPGSDPRIFNNLNNPYDKVRSGYCLYLHRYFETGLPIADFLGEARILSRHNPLSLAEMAELFRRSELLFTYERTSAAFEAALCGCPVVYMESPLLTSFPRQKLVGHDGHAWGFTESEIARAKATLGDVARKYDQVINEFGWQLRRFVSMTQGFAQDMQAKAAG